VTAANTQQRARDLLISSRAKREGVDRKLGKLERIHLRKLAHHDQQ
jgi:hypothetical protein